MLNMVTAPDSQPGRIIVDNETLNKFLDTLDYFQTRKFLKRHGSRYPRFLYKFRRLQNTEDINHLREIIVRSVLWLSSPAKFNDPFDMSAKFLFDATVEEKRQAFRGILKEQGKKFHEIEHLLPEFMRTFNENHVIERLRKITEKIGVCAFAGDPRNILMWSHYAANHEGLCLVFELARDPKTFMDVLPVEYSVEYPILDWFRDFNNDSDTLRIVRRKHIGWKYEKEWRLIGLAKSNTHIKFLPERFEQS